MELLVRELLAEIEAAYRQIALEPAVTSNPDDAAWMPLAVLV